MPETMAIACEGATRTWYELFAISPAALNINGRTMETPIPTQNQPKVIPIGPPTKRPIDRPLPATSPSTVIEFFTPNF